MSSTSDLVISPAEILQTFYCIRDISGESGVAAVKYLLGQGVDFQMVVEPDPPISARVAIQGRYFDVVGPDEEGHRAILFLARDSLGDPLDIVAWRPRSGELVVWLGAAPLLGEDDLLRARIEYEGALPVWRSPLDWLRAGRKGVVLIDTTRAASRLADLGPLLAEDPAHGLELRKLLTRPAPRIVVSSSSAMVAA